MELRTLEEWSLVFDYSNPYQAPEIYAPKLVGKVYNSEKYEDGTLIETAKVTGSQGEIIVTSTGTKYILGKPNMKYEEKFPNSRERILRAIKNTPTTVNITNTTSIN